MAPPLARLSPAGGAASADAQPQAARARGARPAGNLHQSGAEALVRLVFERRVAGPRPDLSGGYKYLGLERMAYYVNKDAYRRTVRAEIEQLGQGDKVGVQP